MLGTREGRLGAVILGAVALGALLALLRPRDREREGAPPPAASAGAFPEHDAGHEAAGLPVAAPPQSTPAGPPAAPYASRERAGRASAPRTSAEPSPQPVARAAASAGAPASGAASTPTAAAPAEHAAQASPDEAPAPQTPPGATGVIAVSCVDEGGLAVAGVRLGFNPGEGELLDATSDSRGWAERQVPPGKYAVSQWVWTLSFERQPEVDVAVAAGERKEVTLPVRRTGTLEGTVVGGAPRSPRLRVVVRKTNGAATQEGTIQLDEAGRFTDQRTAGSYEMSIVGDDGTSSAPQEVRIQPDQTTRVTFAVGAGSPLVVGRVRAASDGRAIAGANVDADGCGVTTTDAAGEFVLRGSGGLPGEVNVRAEGYVETSVALDQAKGPPLEVTVDLALGGSLRVAILDREGKPASDVEVVVKTEHGNHSSSHSTRVGGEGVLKMSSLEPGTYRVYLAGSDDEHPDATLEVRAGEEAAAQVTLKPK